MSEQSPSATDGSASGASRRPRRRRGALIGLGAVAALGGLGAAVLPGSSPAAATDDANEALALTTARVTRGDLAETRSFSGRVSFGETWNVSTAATGTITQAPDRGEVVRPGEELVRIDDRPLTVAKGDMPMYRTLRRIRSGERDQFNNRLSEMEGEDVRQLQQFLLDAGYDDEERLEVDGIFAKSTERAVKEWQEAAGLPVSGQVDNSQLIFSAIPLRVASEMRVGDPFSGLAVGEADAQVFVDTSNRDRSALPIGGQVSIDIDGSNPVPGTVTEQEEVTNEQGQRVWRTTITPNAPLASSDVGATIEAEQQLVSDVLLVPVGALLALAEGGFAVEVATGDGTTQLRRVEVGQVLKGRAEVSGDIDVDDQVVVPT